MLQRSFTTISIACYFILISISAISQGITTPRVPSPAAEVSQTIGISTITIRYSRPSVKKRAVWGNLVPYDWNVQQFGAGNSAPWRAGANENTTIRFSNDVTVAGKQVAAGTYGLFFVINKDNTGEVILSKESRAWGSFFYDPKQDELRAPVAIQVIPFTELLTYDFVNVSKTSADMVLNWETKQFPVRITFDVDKLVMENAREELKGPAGFNWQGFATAANYALQNNTNLDEALTWIDKALVQNKSFATLSIKSGIQKAMNKTVEAEATMRDAIAIATENEINLYGYQVLNAGKHDEAIELFILNTKKFPKSPNTWDSLGEGYYTKGDKKNAILNFKKSLGMNPPLNVKANSEKFLRELGAL